MTSSCCHFSVYSTGSSVVKNLNIRAIGCNSVEVAGKHSARFASKSADIYSHVDRAELRNIAVLQSLFSPLIILSFL